MKKKTTIASSLAASEEVEEELEQKPESITRMSNKQGTISLATPGVDEIEPPETLEEEFELYEETGFVSAALHQYADDVSMPGVRASADNEETEKWLNDTFLPHAGAVGGQRHQSMTQVVYQSVIEYLAHGNILSENMTNGEDQITGFMLLNPASCKAMLEPNKPLLRPPDAVEEDWWNDGDDEYPTTDDGDAAAFVQFHNDSILGRRGRYDDQDDVAFSMNEVTYRPRNPPAGEIWGTPITRNVKEELIEFKNIRKDMARAIRTKAWGIWSVAFDTEVIETKDQVFVDEWSEEERDNFVDDLGSMEPGEIVGHDGTISFDKHEGEVPEEVLDVLGTYVKMIVAALPPPLYAVGFEDNINQFVVKEQEKIYEASVRSMQTTVEDTWTPALRQVCEDHGKDDSGVELHLEPPEDESPIRSMELEDMEKFALFADGLSSMIGRDPYRAFKPDEFADLVAQVPGDALKPEAFVGVPGGVPDGISNLSVLERIHNEGSVEMNLIDDLRSEIAQASEPGDVPVPSNSFVNPYREQTGGGGGIFGEGDEDEDSEGQEAVQNSDGTFAGSS